MKKQLLILIALCITAIGYSQTFTENFITYFVTSVANNTVKTINYNTAGGVNVVINGTVTDTSTGIMYSVTEIGGFSQKNISSIDIPNTVTKISAGAFTNNTNLTGVNLPDSITSIGSTAFNNCNLITINIPTSMTVIENSTFSICNLNSITIPNNITSIGDYAFSNNNLTSVFIPNSVVSLGLGVFSSNNITTSNIPDGTTTIPNFLFQFNNLSNITIPATVTVIGEGAFRSNNLNSISIPDNVVTIGNVAFRANQLTSVTIPINVTTIGERAFNANPLANVFSESTTPPVITTTADFTDTFSSNRSTIHLHIPAGTMGAYVTDAGALWTGFNPVSEDALSVSDFDLANSIKVITTEDEIKVISPDSIRLENYTIYSISGVKIKEGTENAIAIDTLSSGIYIIELNFDKGRLAKKFIVN